MQGTERRGQLAIFRAVVGHPAFWAQMLQDR